MKMTLSENAIKSVGVEDPKKYPSILSHVKGKFCVKI
jgi:hypothetical protein